MQEVLVTSHNPYRTALPDSSLTTETETCLEAILKLILMLPGTTTRQTTCSLWLTDESQRHQPMRMIAACSMPPSPTVFHPLPSHRQAVISTAARGQSFMVMDIACATELTDQQDTIPPDLASMLGIPMEDDEGRIAGVLAFFTDSSHPFSDREATRITTVVNQAAGVLLKTGMVLKTRLIRDEMETRRLVEEAGAILKRRHRVGNEEVLDRIRTWSERTKKSVRQIAEAIVLSEWDYCC